MQRANLSRGILLAGGLALALSVSASERLYKPISNDTRVLLEKHQEELSQALEGALHEHSLIMERINGRIQSEQLNEEEAEILMRRELAELSEQIAIHRYSLARLRSMLDL